MSYENINFKYPNMCMKNSYFYMFDHDMDVLVQKVDDGMTSFTYPTNVVLGSEIKSLEYGGGYFWSLQSNDANSEFLKKWKIDNFLCKLQHTYVLGGFVTVSGGDTHSIQSTTFSLESYKTTIVSSVSVGDDYFLMSVYYDIVASGIEVMLGPNSNGEYSYATVTSVSGNTVYVDSPYVVEFSVGCSVEFAKHVWVFNDESYNAVDNGSLYKFDAIDMSYIEHYNDIEYDGIKASTFMQNASSAFGSNINAIVYVKSTNLKFIDVNNITNVKFMVMDNIRINGTTVITVYDIVVYNDAVFRLQHEATYYGVDNSWTKYNYQVSPIRRFVDSMTVDAANKILNSDGVSIAEVISTVFDQYNDPVFMKLVFFDDNNDTGYMTISPAYTRSDGMAYSYYRAGTSPAHIIITATATQND